jgi:glycosyltransferase involved in cell wall biosynthesis
MTSSVSLEPVGSCRGGVAAAGGILLIAYHFRSTSESGATRPRRFAKYLSESGKSIHVITNGSPGESSERVCCTAAGAGGGRGVEFSERVAAAIERRFLPYNEALPWVPHAVSAGSEIIRRFGITSILSTSPPLATHFAAWELKRRFKLHWVADFRDPLSDNPFRNRGWGKPYDRGVEKRLFRSADRLIANTDSVAQVWRKRYPRWAYKVHLIWNGYDPDDRIASAPIPERPYRVLTHVGTLYEGRRPTVLLESLSRLIDSRRLDPKTFQLRLIGPLDTRFNRVGEPPFSTLIEKACLHYNGASVPQSEAREEITTADQLLVLDLNESGSDLQVPAKLFEYIRVGRPILAFTASGSPTERILVGSGLPHCAISPAAPNQEIDDQVCQFLKQPSAEAQPSEWFSQQFDARTQAALLSDMLEPGRR